MDTQNQSPKKNTSVQAFKLEPRSTKADEKSGRIWTLTFDTPNEKVNKLGKKVMAEFENLIDHLETLGRENKIDALILLSAKPGNFIAGADIDMILATKTALEAEELSRSGHQLFNRWEDLPFPTIAAIDGATMGGGCELSLASTAVVMSDSPASRIGLPEVMLGLLPGGGGCIRLPRKVGLANALDLILSSRTLNGEKAYRMGLAEACIPKENFEDSVFRWVKQNLKDLKSHKRIAKEPKLGGVGGPIGTLMEKTPLKAIVFKKAREGVMQKTRGVYPAPLEAIDVIQQTGGSYGERLRGAERDRALQREAKGFGKLAATEVSKNLIGLFFLTEDVKKSKGLASGSAAVKERPIHQAAVLGAGIMGGGIAQLFADKNVDTRMKDLSNQALALGIQSANKIFQKQVKKKKINARQYLQKLGKITPVTDYAGFQGVELVVEAIVENIDIKKKVFQELEGKISADCIVASNTSSLSVSEMQKVFKNPERFLGLHFFNPVEKMPLVEIIRGEKTSDEAVSALFQLSKKLGKTPIVTKDRAGFLVNRLLTPYLNEAVYLAMEGVPIPELDRVLLKFGMPMGPMELIDEVGIDVAEKVGHVLHAAFGERMVPAPLNQKILAAGYLGKKNGKGLYTYTGPKKTKEFDPKVYSIIGVTPSHAKVSDEEIVERCILPMINEAARCLEEKIVASPSEVDLGMIMGTGFPPFRGGLLRYADTLGAKLILERLKKYHAKLGNRYEPSAALIARAEKNQTFY